MTCCECIYGDPAASPMTYCFFNPERMQVSRSHWCSKFQSREEEETMIDKVDLDEYPITTHKYEIDKRYPFKATADSVCPVPDDAMVYAWGSKFSLSPNEARAGSLTWDNGVFATITHFMVTEYPAVKHTAWVNVHPILLPHKTKAEANAAALQGRAACIEIEWTEGEGL